MSQFDDLEEVLGKEDSITINGKEFIVYELGLSNIIKLMKKLGSIKGVDKSNMAAIIADNIPTFVEVVAYATKSPVKAVQSAIDNNKISLNGFIDLALKVVEVNSDVFLQATRKLVAGAQDLGNKAKVISDGEK